MSRPQPGQTLVGLALCLPLVLLPVAGYAIESTLLAARASALHAAVAQAAEDAASAIDVGALRSGHSLRLDGPAAAAIAAQTLRVQAPAAVLDSVSVGLQVVSVGAHEPVPLAFGAFLGSATVTVRASAAARLAVGYERPSSRLPFPSRIFSSAG